MVHVCELACYVYWSCESTSFKFTTLVGGLLEDAKGSQPGRMHLERWLSIGRGCLPKHLAGKGWDARRLCNIIHKTPIRIIADQELM